MANAGNPDTLLLFSDVHFDPFADPSLVTALAASDVSAWKTILSSSSKTSYPAYGSDSNYALFESALDDMAARAGNVTTIIYPGDTLSHHFDKDYATLTGDTSRTGLDSFIQKTVDFFVQEVDSRFPDATVLMAIGNNDSALGDYASTPGDPYLSSTAPAISQAFFNNDADRAAFAASYAMGGYYAVEPDGPTGLKYIVLNDVYWSARVDDPGPGVVELSWFASELADSARDFQKVWVVMHIPNGTDASSSASDFDATGKADYKGYLSDGFNNAFTALESAYDATITATFAGHTHRDDFRLIAADNSPSVAELIRVSPAITTYTGSNPSYQLYSYDAQSTSLLDETTYSLDLQSSAPTWNTEYNYAETYGQGLATPQEWQAVYADILTNPVSQAAYINYHNGDATSQNTITAANASVYLLAPGFTTPAAFNAAAAVLA
jgi:hypothetical protein